MAREEFEQKFEQIRTRPTFFYHKKKQIYLTGIARCGQKIDTPLLLPTNKQFRITFLLLSPSSFSISAFARKRQLTPSRGQFYQPYGAEHKCTGSHSSVPVGTVQFHKLNYTQLHHYTQLENMLNFYTLCPALYANKFSINLLA